MNNTNLISKIKEILKGIDETETCDENGWWETSTGAEFGKKKLEQIIAEIEVFTEPSKIPKLSQEEFKRVFFKK